ncbi:MAG: hypothetical protein ACK5TK_11530, partial [Betaproteobacteria bacterium]
AERGGIDFDCRFIAALSMRRLLPLVAVGREVSVTCDGCAAGLTAKIDFISPQAEFTPPVIYSNESRAKLVFMVEARPTAESRAAFKPGQPVQVRLRGG